MFPSMTTSTRPAGTATSSSARKLVEPPGECRSNHEVVCALAERLGAEHAGFGMTALEVADATLQASGWPGAAARAGGAGSTRRRRSHARISSTASAIPTAASTSPRTGRRSAQRRMPGLPDHWAATDAATADHPFRMVAAPARQFLNSTFSQVRESRRREVRPSVLLHPDDAARLGIAAGDRVGSATRAAPSRCTPGSAAARSRGVVVVESVWPGADFPGGIGINALISAQAASPAGGAVFHDTAVWVRPERP